MATEARSSVELDRVSKQFADLLAVDNLSLELREGEFFTLLGPSGCGKTTTLRMIAGFEQPTSGRVLIDGADVVDLPPNKRPTNTVFQSYALFPHLSVADNVAFGLKRKGAAKPEITRRVAEELERVGLSREINRRPNQLSGGQQQRVALARALVNLPKVLLLDEPLGALDLKLRKGLQVQLKQIQRDVGITFVYVTHDQEEALTMSDRIAVMNHGKIEQLGTPEDVYERPASAFVAGFVGVSNLIERNGQRFTIRPEKIRIHTADASTNGHPSVDGVVESSLYVGTATQVIVKLGDSSPITVLVPNADEAERQRLPGGGAKVRLSWLSEHMHLIPESHEPEKEPNA